jgi:voltage-gated potassium channel
MHPASGDDVIEQELEELPAGASRRLVVRGLLRASLTATVLVVLYFTLPITGSLDGSAALLLVAGLLGFAGVITWQVRAVLRSQYPGLRAIEALAFAIPLFLLVFAAAYLRMADADAGAFSEPLSRTDALYFTITVFSTVGFGDITPKTDLARVATMVQMLGDLLVVGLVLHLMLGAVKAGLQRRAAASAGFSDSSDREDAGPVSTHRSPEQDGAGA